MGPGWGCATGQARPSAPVPISGRARSQQCPNLGWGRMCEAGQRHGDGRGAGRWERLGAWEWDSTWGTARGHCPLPGCGVGRSQGLRGQDEPRREGSAARRSVWGCKQLDPANEASLSKDVSCARAQHHAALLSWPCWEGTHTHTHTPCWRGHGCGAKGPGWEARGAQCQALQAAGGGRRAGSCHRAGPSGANEAGDARSRPAWPPGVQPRAAGPPPAPPAGQWGGESGVWGGCGKGTGWRWPYQCCPLPPGLSRVLCASPGGLEHGHRSVGPPEPPLSSRDVGCCRGGGWLWRYPNVDPFAHLYLQPPPGTTAA